MDPGLRRIYFWQFTSSERTANRSPAKAGAHLSRSGTRRSGSRLSPGRRLYSVECFRLRKNVEFAVPVIDVDYGAGADPELYGKPVRDRHLQEIAFDDRD